MSEIPKSTDPSIRLPLIYDDLLHIRIAKGLDLVSVWLPTDEFGFWTGAWHRVSDGGDNMFAT